MSLFPTILPIDDLDPVRVLCGLYNCAAPRGAGWFDYVIGPLTVGAAEDVLAQLDEDTYIDSLNGRTMKLSLKRSTAEISVVEYDRCTAEGVGFAVIALLEDGLDPNCRMVRKFHHRLCEQNLDKIPTGPQFVETRVAATKICNELFKEFKK